MQKVKPHESPELPFERPPTEDELPYSDGMPMESHRHVLQCTMLTAPLRAHWRDRGDVFIASDMFVYFSEDQLKTEDFRGPDVFVALGVSPRGRKSWVVWYEGKGPDVVIELLSESTARRDRTEKKAIYQDKLRVPEYFWYDPYTEEFAGFMLVDGVYREVEPDAEGRLRSDRLDLLLTRWHGVYEAEEAPWLRWAEADGTLLPTDAEMAERERQAAERERERVAELEARLARYEQQFGRLDGED